MYCCGFFLLYTDGRLEQERTKHKMLQSELARRIEDVACLCPTCGKDDFVSEALANRTATVLWIGLETRFYVEVPVTVCGPCQTAFTVNPMHIGCFPGSAKHGWSVIKPPNPVNTTVIWFDIALLRYAELSSHHMKRVSTWQFAELLDKLHMVNGSAPSVHFDQLRKALAICVHEFGYLLNRVDDMNGLGVKDWPSGIFGRCGGCWTAGQPTTLQGLESHLPHIVNQAECTHTGKSEFGLMFVG